MSITHFSPATSFFLLLSILATVTTALYSPLNILSARQQEIDQALCNQYSTIANLSVVGANATYRSAYLQASPEGGYPAREPLDSAIPKLPAFKFNEEVNDFCGNLSEVAMEGAAANFTQGIVLQFNLNSAAQVGASAMGLAVIMGMVVLTVVDVV